jgi:hypothetical protein
MITRDVLEDMNKMQLNHLIYILHLKTGIFNANASINDSCSHKHSLYQI